MKKKTIKKGDLMLRLLKDWWKENIGSGKYNVHSCKGCFVILEEGKELKKK